MRRKLILLFPITILMMVLFAQKESGHPVPLLKYDDLPASPGARNTGTRIPLIVDTYEEDSGLWSYRGTAFRGEGTMVLTTPNPNSAGAAWLKTNVTGRWKVSFRYKAGGGTGGDGLAFLWVAGSSEAVPSGGYLGFEPAEGYAVIFDNFYNPELNDPAGNYIALVKRDITNKLASFETVKTEDYNWHDVEIKFTGEKLVVLLDRVKVLSEAVDGADPLRAIGFSASTGEYTNSHIIDNFSIELEPS
ncbi:lectin-like domain-containing protein [Paenibacillus oleatilyticus]|uniref:lectin-like domain-containing protein n=1 Tax=Paenibacillus oleatilyticus TaxID=2594886 RepID=UPI001C1F245A|nr:hypothetical protein [Paenibacillus oleatilyticus]MBU7320080.1 hypothetical protein [Paenibacillus oleatilyticus]